MITVVVIVAIIVVIAAPALSQALANQRLRAAATDLMSALLVARSEAIKRGVQMRVAPLVEHDWTSGWRVVAADSGEQVEKIESLGQWVEVSYAPEVIAYERNGRIAAVGTTRVEFRDSAGSSSGVPARCVMIDPAGMPRLVQASCS
jgi:type IV fimbrial biogenesis protein FimT